MANDTSTPRNTDESSFDIRGFLATCLHRWYWFVIAAVVAIGSLLFIYLRQTPTYERSMRVLIKSDANSSGVMSNVEAFSNFNSFGSNGTVANEIQAFLSTDLMAEVVKRMQLDVEYWSHGVFHDKPLFGDSQPFTLQFLDLAPNTHATLLANLDTTGTLTLTDFTLGDDRLDGEATFVCGDTATTPLGRIVATSTHPYPATPCEVEVRKNSYAATVGAYKSKLQAVKADKQSDVIRLSVTDQSPLRAEHILDTLVEVYNEQWIKNKNIIVGSTSEFISERLKHIESELSAVDANISSYKSANLLPDVKTAANIYMNESNAINNQIMEINNQLYVAQYIRDYLVDKSNNTSPIPSISGINNSSLDRQIAEYNEQILRRNNLVAQSSERNSLVVTADRTLEILRQSIQSSMDNNIYALRSQLQHLRQGEARVNARISANPAQARQLLSVERQQSVKEALYIFLLQKREENELSQAFKAYNTRIIETPTGSNAPVSPKRRKYLFIAVLLAIAVPAGIIAAEQALDTTVRGRSDLDVLDAPLLGEIPLRQQKTSGRPLARLAAFWSRLRRRFGRGTASSKGTGTPGTNEAVVKEGKRDVINEAFRVLRTNLEYISNQQGCTVLQQTSLNAGSGKSFLTLNTAICIAIKKKRVLIIDGDLRRGTSSLCVNSPQKGLSNYLNGTVSLDNINEVIYSYSGVESLDVIPIGKMPPNPTELIGNGRFPVLIKAMREKYDYIFIDCPPVEIVADTQIIAHDVDRTIFVVRAGLMERAALPEVQKFVDSDKLKNTVILLNGTKSGGSSYYGGRKGYYYGSYYHSYGNKYYNAE